MASYSNTTDSLTIKGVHYISTVVTGSIINGDANSITATLKDVDAATVTSFNDYFTVTAQDENEATVQVSSDGITFTDEIDVSATSGVFTGNVYFSLPVGVGTKVYVRFQVASDFEINGYLPYGVDEVSIGTLTLVFTAEPSSVVRDSNFSMTVQAQDGFGNLLSARTDTITITLNSPDGSDVFTSPTPDAVSYTASLSSGEWSTTTEQITGGSGNETGVTITATATGFIGDITTFNITEEAVVTLYDWNCFRIYSGETIGHWGANSEAGWLSEWDQAHDVSGHYTTSDETQFSIDYAHGQLDFGGWKTTCRISRLYLKFDKSAYVGLATDATIRIPYAYDITQYWDEDQNTNLSSTSMNIYRISNDLSGGDANAQAQDVLIQALAGTLEDSKTLAVLKPEYEGSGYFEFDVDHTAISAAGTYVRYVMLFANDYADTPNSYGTTSTTLNRPGFYAQTGHPTLQISV